MKKPGRWVPVLVAAAMILCLALVAPPISVRALPAKMQGVEVVPTAVCSCASQIQASVLGAPQFKGHSPPTPSGLYDEQVGLTFTQSFTSIEYNVTAVEQTDQTLGDGPGYLLSGLSNTGYWYQVGVSWDWNPGTIPGTGFDFNYEVFDTAGNSIFPTNGQGGLAVFSGPVNAGDVVLLDLYFSSSSQNVVMLARDTNTGATASEAYPNMGATFFVGLPGSVANQNGFFTGLMTEWYHGVPYYSNEAEVIYSNPATALSSAWMWMDEFNANNFQAIFSANTLTPISYNNPNNLQEFSFNGTTEYSDAYEFVTGALTNSTQHSPSNVPLTLSYTVQGNGAGYSPPILTYVLNGTSSTIPLTGSPTVYPVDVGTSWSVSMLLGGPTSSERFATDQPTSGIANSSQTIEFVYYTQDYVGFGFSVSGGGSGYSPPSVTYSSFGASATTPTGAGVWADAGSRYQYQSLLPGSTSSERWYAQADGSVGSSSQIDAVYYHQYLATLDVSFQNTELFPSVTLTSTSAAQPYSATLVLGTNTEWLDSGSTYSVPQSFTLESGQRLITNGTVTGVVSAGLAVELVYEHQFYIGITQNVSGGGTTSPSSGWYDSGLELQMNATAAPGWEFEGWSGVGADSASNSSASFALTVGPGAPANETAAFYPGVTIDARGPDSVTYQDGSISGTVAAGTKAQLYVPPSSTLSLKASNTAFLATFNGWSGATSSSGTGASLTVQGPGTVTSNSEYNYSEIGVPALAIALVAIIVVIALTRRRAPSETALS